jgi:polyhydroxyalkanoate synthesis regulator phasin
MTPSSPSSREKKEKGQSAVEELSAKGLLNVDGMVNKLQNMKKQANDHQSNLEELIPALESEGLSPENIQTAAQETEQKATEIMRTYLGEDPDSSSNRVFMSRRRWRSYAL